MRKGMDSTQAINAAHIRPSGYQTPPFMVAFEMSWRPQRNKEAHAPNT